MSKKRILIDRLEFYITNVCNLTCSNCNRYNNYHFKGWTSWDEYEENLRQWATKIDIRHPVILGGEPLMNRDIVKWINNIRKLWPSHSGVQVQSNGTRIDRVRGLYEALDPWEGNWIGVSIHDPNDREEIFSRIRNFLKPPIRETADKSHPIGSDFQFIDSTNVQVHAWISHQFVNSNIIEQPNGRFTLYRSDPNKAHENCTFRRFKNYHWINGRIYKCGPVGLMPQFDDQHDLDISPEDKILLREYKGLGIEEFDEIGLKFFTTIDDVIPQCKFCPESYEYKPITFSDRKKSWKISTEIL